MSIFIIATSYANPKFMKSLNRSYKSFRWKIIKVLFKNRLERERLMTIANLLDPRNSLWQYQYKPTKQLELDGEEIFSC